MLPLRKLVFWSHLITGLLAGVMIAIMSVTGAALAFEKQLVAWSEREVRRFDVPEIAVTPRPLDELVQAARAAAGDKVPTSIVVSNDPAAAVAVSFGRDATYYVNPYSGEARMPASTSVHDFLHTLEDWHRFLGREGASRPVGKLINGIANVVFFVLAVTGIYIWWPRRWEWRIVRPSLWFAGGQRGRARDWNWHNVAGFWTAPVLVVLTLTAVPISFRWAGNGIYKLFGESPPAQGGPGAMASAPVRVPSPAPGAQRLSHDELLAKAQQESPGWETITFRLGTVRGRGPMPAPAGVAAPPNKIADPRAQGETPATTQGAAEGRRAEAPRPQAVTIAVSEKDRWPRFAAVTYSFDPYTGAVLRKETLADASPARRFRSWTRFLHTGEALGYAGQFVAMIASLAGALLVYTGFALSWRRFFGKKSAG